MEIQSVNAENRLVNVAAAVGRNPKSWSGWSCLMLDITALDEDQQQDCLVWIKSIIDSYLKDVEGRVYFCENGSIHLFAKNISDTIFHQVGQQICDLIASEMKLAASYDYFDLAHDGIFYAQHVLEKYHNYNSLRVSSTVDLAALIDNKFGQRPVRPLGGTAPSHPNVKVLLVEDDPVTRWMVRNALKEHCHFASAPDAGKAFSMYESYKPDVVFLDIGLPDKSGRIVLDWIMSHNPSACVVMLSANDHMDNIAGVLEDGASGFIAKPFLKDHLLYYIKNYHAG